MKNCILGRKNNVCLIHGNSEDFIHTLKFDAIITDPPYGIGYVHKGVWGKNKRDMININTKPIYGDDKPFDPSPLINVTGTDKPLALFGANHYCNHIPPRVGSWLVWDKSCGQGPASNFVDAELCWINRSTKRVIFRHMWMGCIREGRDGSENTNRMHPSMKPVELMAWIMDVARVGIGKTVLDPYMGIGSTGVACLLTGRPFIGIEIDEEYYEIAKARLTKELARLDACLF